MRSRGFHLVSLLFLFPSSIFCCLLEDGRSAVYLSVFEDLRPGEVIATLPIKGDLHAKENGIHLRLVKGQDVVELKEKDLSLKRPLDREEGASKFEAVLECSMDDPRSDFKMLNISVLVLVKDVNDNAPVFDQEKYEVEIPEELPIGTMIFASFEASDADQSGPNSLVHYSIVNEGPHGDLLKIPDPEKPIVVKRLDYEAPLHSFDVEIEAADQGEPQLRTRVPLHVTIKDIDDLPPRFDSLYHYSKMISNGQLVIIPPIHAEDGDAINAPIVYQLGGELASHFSIDRDGSVRIRSNPPPPLATLFIHAYQEDNQERNATAFLHIDLLPTLQFEHDRYSAQIQSDIAPSTLISQVRAFARNENSMVKYSIEDADALVSVDEKFGKVARTRLSLQFSPESPCQGGIKFEQDAYEMQLGSNNFIGEISLAARSQPAAMKLLNLNNYFSLDNAGRLTLAPSGLPPCDYCELIVSATDKEGRVALTKVIVHNLSPAMSTTGMLSILLLVVVILLLILLTLFASSARRHFILTTSRRATKDEDAVSYLYGVRRMTSSMEREKSATVPPCTIVEDGEGGIYVINSDTKTTSSPSSTTKSSLPSSSLTGPVSPPSRSPTYRSSAAPAVSGARLVPITVTSHEGAPTVYF
ncbi:cdh-9 [Pristionchus pacificus]|uniref:Cdh-9 n=1 Tax=Pristionchus pacificus TaxID=54126 RepID=A0A2A6BGF4_PRIPA|nr:cdh-9 [Pristionchus pacificus]|eukprot:PDM64969.1 cdh-9 [Pristionchus pacificus]